MKQKRVFIVHGWEGYPEEGWFPWIKVELEKRGIQAEVPAMPNTVEPEINEWITYLSDLVNEADENTYFVGHSIGCQAILRYLETLSDNIKVGGVILVAGWIHLKPEGIEEEGADEVAKPWLETPIQWNKVTKHTNKFICIFSDDDPFVYIEDAKIFEDKLHSKTIIERGKGHFSGSDDITEMPIVLDELLNIF